MPRCWSRGLGVHLPDVSTIQHSKQATSVIRCKCTDVEAKMQLHCISMARPWFQLRLPTLRMLHTHPPWECSTILAHPENALCWGRQHLTHPKGGSPKKNVPKLWRIEDMPYRILFWEEKRPQPPTFMTFCPSSESLQWWPLYSFISETRCLWRSNHPWASFYARKSQGSSYDDVFTLSKQNTMQPKNIYQCRHIERLKSRNAFLAMFLTPQYELEVSKWPPVDQRPWNNGTIHWEPVLACGKLGLKREMK